MSVYELSREELYQKVWSKPMTHLAAEFGISDRGLAKICIRMEIPLPGIGYWRKVELGQSVKQEELPPLSKQCQKAVTIRSTEKKDPVYLEESALVLKVREIESCPTKRIVVPETIRKYHPVVKRTLEALLKDSYKQYGLYSPRGEGILDITCSKESAPRAAKIFHTLWISLEKRGYAISVNPGYGHDTFVECFDEKIQISLREKVKQVPYKPSKGEKASDWGPKVDYIPTGNLVIRVEDGWRSRLTWMDTPKSQLEVQLNDVIVGLAQAATTEKQDRAEKERQHREWVRRQEHQAMLRQQQLEEEKRVQHIEALLSNWLKANHLREFLKLAQQSSDQIAYPGMEDSEWFSWAYKYAEALDPFC